MPPPPPSVVLRAIADRLRAELGELAAEVRAHEGNFGADGKDFVTVKPPTGVLVFCPGATVPDDDEFIGMLQFVAIVIARQPNPEKGQVLVGDVAMDLAWLIAGIARNETWGFAEKAPERLRVTNEHTNGLMQKGLTVWSVSWLQEVPAPSPESIGAALQSLRKIHFDFYQGTADTLPPKHEALVELNGADPDAVETEGDTP